MVDRVFLTRVKSPPGNRSIRVDRSARPSETRADHRSVPRAKEFLAHRASIEDAKGQDRIALYRRLADLWAEENAQDVSTIVEKVRRNGAFGSIASHIEGFPKGLVGMEAHRRGIGGREDKDPVLVLEMDLDRVDSALDQHLIL